MFAHTYHLLQTQMRLSNVAASLAGTVVGIFPHHLEHV